ncbi:MAG: DnaA ATPase domain-containing protein, partial [Tepidisphaeraceae bacterium]
MSCISVQDPQLARLADAIAQRVGPQRFHVWFNNSTRLDLKHDGLEIAVPNDFISEWIDTHYTRSIQEAAHEVLGCSLPVRFSVVPQLFETVADDDVRSGSSNGNGHTNGNGAVRTAKTAHANGNSVRGEKRTAPRSTNGKHHGGIEVAASNVVPILPAPSSLMSDRDASLTVLVNRPRLRHDIESFVVGPGSQLACNSALYVAEFPGSQYNPLFVHGNCGLGKTHLLQGLCRRFAEHHPTKRWMYLTGEEFTNEFLSALRNNRLDAFRRKVRDLDLLAIDDVHFLSGKRATQEEFLHTFNAIEAIGRQVVMASDNHPKMIEEFGESLVNRFISGMVVRIDPPNFATRCQIMRSMTNRSGLHVSDDVIAWVARRVTQNVRELEGALTRIAAHVALTGR